MVKTKAPPAGAVSNDPEDALQAGLPDDFDGEITRVRYTKWSYPNRDDINPILVVRVEIEPDAASGLEPLVSYDAMSGASAATFSAGDLAHFVPHDGDDLCDLDSDNPEDWEGIYAVKAGVRDQLSKGSNWGFFVTKLQEAGFEGNTAQDVSFAEGLYCHFKRLPQPKRSGIVQVNEDGKAKASDILVVTDILEKPKTAKGSKKKAAKTKAKAETAEDLDEQIENLLLELLADADEDGLAKSKIATAFLRSKKFKGADLKAAVKRATSTEFLLAGELWEYDADEGVVTLA